MTLVTFDTVDAAIRSLTNALPKLAADVGTDGIGQSIFCPDGREIRLEFEHGRVTRRDFHRDTDAIRNPAWSLVKPSPYPFILV